MLSRVAFCSHNFSALMCVIDALDFNFSFNTSNEFAFYLVPDSRIENDFLSQSISHNAPIGKTVIGV